LPDNTGFTRGLIAALNKLINCCEYESLSKRQKRRRHDDRPSCSLRRLVRHAQECSPDERAVQQGTPSWSGQETGPTANPVLLYGTVARTRVSCSLYNDNGGLRKRNQSLTVANLSLDSPFRSSKHHMSTLISRVGKCPRL